MLQYVLQCVAVCVVLKMCALPLRLRRSDSGRRWGCCTFECSTLQQHCNTQCNTREPLYTWRDALQHILQHAWKHTRHHTLCNTHYNTLGCSEHRLCCAAAARVCKCSHCHTHCNPHLTHTATHAATHTRMHDAATHTRMQ